jgi:hypothetical protein
MFLKYKSLYPNQIIDTQKQHACDVNNLILSRHVQLASTSRVKIENGGLQA